VERERFWLKGMIFEFERTVEFLDFGIFLDVGIFDFSGFRNFWRDFGCRFDCLEFGCI